MDQRCFLQRNLFRGQSSLAFICLLFVGCQGDSESPSTRAPAVTAASEDVTTDSVAARIESIQIAISNRDLEGAKSIVRQSLIQFPDNPAVAELAGDVHRLAGEHQRAIEFFQAARNTVTANQKPPASLLDKLGRSWMATSRPFEALAVLKELVATYPENPLSRADLAGLLASVGLEHDAAEHLQWLVQRGHAGVRELVLLSDLTRPQTDTEMCNAVLARNPDDIRPNFSLARMEAHLGRWPAVAQLLRPIVNSYPENATACVLYLRALVEIGDEQSIDILLRCLPSNFDTEVQYWLATGVYSERHRNLEEAANAFWEAVQIDEFEAEALSRLNACLAELDTASELRKTLVGRIEAITKIRSQIDALSARNFDSQAIVVKIAKQMDALGRSWESAAWLRVGATMKADIDPTLAATYQSVRSRLTGRTPWHREELSVVRNVDLSHLPMMNWQSRRPMAPSTMQPLAKKLLNVDPSEPTIIRFEDQASARNLNHVCKIKKSAGEEADLRIYQSVAGGVGVIDFDLDSWPDLYLTMMNGEPNKPDSEPNQLFRNTAGQFVNVTPYANVSNGGFSQGIAVGDYDMDGFSDVFVATIGENRLYRNNGDGTFADVTQRVGISGSRWTSSVMIADIDQDGYTDLFEVGYCKGEDAVTKTCTRDGFTRSCSPLSFSGQPDRIWRGQADGSFVDATAAWLGKHDEGCGLAIVAGRFDERPGLDLFVANDMSANHFWSSQHTSDGQFKLSEQGALRGVAVDARSLAQACMGIAVADPDADGDFDFFVTNHANEPNTFYEQVAPGLWVDHTERVGLSVPSSPMLGFGTVWFDADNNGSLELMVANGHVDDFSHLGEAFRMPMHLYQRDADGSWNLLDSATIGNAVNKKQLARNLVNVDVNRDGRVDAVVTRLFDPVALLINSSPTTAASITLFLKSTQGHPDAIGSIVSVSAGERVYRSQLIGGDGFQCSGQRCVRFGLGNAASATNVIVDWASGETESFGTLAVGNEYVLVQGEGVAFPLLSQ